MGVGLNFLGQTLRQNPELRFSQAEIDYPLRALFPFCSPIMIKGVLIINNHGKPRLTKFYEYFVCSAILTNARPITFFLILNLNSIHDSQKTNNNKS
jgi:hypothetical protein